MAAEKNQMKTEADKIVKEIKLMEDSLDDNKSKYQHEIDESLRITYPLIPCLDALKERHVHVCKLRDERVEQLRGAYPFASRLNC